MQAAKLSSSLPSVLLIDTAVLHITEPMSCFRHQVVFPLCKQIGKNVSIAICDLYSQFLCMIRNFSLYGATVKTPSKIPLAAKDGIKLFC